MSGWGNRDQYSDAPLFTSQSANGASAQEEFGTEVYAVNAAEAAVADKGITPGWVKVRRGKGALSSVTITAGGTDYANDEVFTVENSAGANAEGTVTTNANGTITSVTITDYGDLFTALNPTITIDTANGVDGELTAVVGGRAGRVTYETLVALNTVVGDATSFSNTSTANVANSTGTADDTVFPDS